MLLHHLPLSYHWLPGLFHHGQSNLLVLPFKSFNCIITADGMSTNLFLFCFLLFSFFFLIMAFIPLVFGTIFCNQHRRLCGAFVLPPVFRVFFEVCPMFSCVVQRSPRCAMDPERIDRSHLGREVQLFYRYQLRMLLPFSADGCMPPIPSRCDYRLSANFNLIDQQGGVDFHTTRTLACLPVLPRHH